MIARIGRIVETARGAPRAAQASPAASATAAAAPSSPQPPAAKAQSRLAATLAAAQGLAQRRLGGAADAAVPEEAKLHESARQQAFPAVAGAAAALLLLKVIDLSSDPAPANRSLHRYITQWLGGPRIVADPETTGSTTPPPKEKDAKAEAKPDATQAAKPDGKSDGKPGLPDDSGSIEKPVSPAERGLLERLGERREQLEQRQRELDLRENLLKAADKKLEERIRDLRNLEGHKGASAGEGSRARRMNRRGAAGDQESRHHVRDDEAEGSGQSVR